MRITDEAFGILLQCVARAPDSASKLINTCTRCQDDLRTELLRARLRAELDLEDLRHRLMVRLLCMEEEHAYCSHGSVPQACPPGPEGRTCALKPGHAGLHNDYLHAQWGSWQALSDDDSEAEADAAEQRAQFTEYAGVLMPDELAQALDDLGPPRD